MVALTDQAIEKIKQLIITGEFTAGSRLPKEQELAGRLGLSRNSLREAVRALTLSACSSRASVTERTSRASSRSSSSRAWGSSAISSPVRRFSSSTRCGGSSSPSRPAWQRAGSPTDDFAALGVCLTEMDVAETTTAFIEADQEFHRVIVAASGNSTLASLIHNLSGGTLRARLWRSATEQGALELTRKRHQDIFDALLAGDAERASAADLIHLAEGEQWLRRLMEDEEELLRDGAVDGGRAS